MPPGKQDVPPPALRQEGSASPADIQTEITALKEQIEQLGREILACQEQKRQMLERELSGQGPFAQEIFRLQQRKMILTTEVQHRKVRINALRFQL